MVRKLRWRTIVVILSAVVLAGGGAGVAYAVTAQVTPSSGVITACVANTSGVVRVVSSASQCRPSEHPVELAASQAPRTVSVDCNTGGSISQALAAEPVIPPLTIDITGTCTEAVSINRDNVTLRAASPGAGIKAPASGDSALTLNGTHIVLNSLTLTGGNPVLDAVSGSISANDLQVGNFPQIGISVSGGASVRVAGGAITCPTDSPEGLGVRSSGEAGLYGVHVSDCAFLGAQANGGSVGFVDSVLEHNGGGVQAYDGGRASISRVVIKDSGQFGAATLVGVLDVFDSTIQDSGEFGVHIVSSGAAVIQGSTIQGSRYDGVFVGDTSLASFLGGNHITENGSYGINCQGSPAVAMITGDPGTVTNNTAGDINCPHVP